MTVDNDSLYCVSENKKRRLILKALFSNPEKAFSIGEIVTKIKLKAPSVHFHVNALEKHELVIKIWPTEKKVLIKITNKGIEVAERLEKV
ncbi:MAG: ArsR family transcriptional regulator [Euryarchaeota archaeon]|nr:ArsR family transcriptional regulator [Euryarchaeota archaeon]MBU4038030.1 helix-turn-helix domain-containing protein [Pseudomonadota bacterium]